jgi:hypothetical protein
MPTVDVKPEHQERPDLTRKKNLSGLTSQKKSMSLLIAINPDPRAAF